MLPSALGYHEVCIVLLHDASENASVKREAVGNQDSGTNRAGIGRWLARLAVICLPPKCRFRGSRFARQECGTQARDRKHQDWDHPSRRGASINDREKGRGLWMRSGDRCAVEFVAGKDRTVCWRLEAGGELLGRGHVMI